jgi:hypothetical protein
MDDKITIIEGPTPTFELVADGWAMGLNETPNLAGIAITRLRTFNGPALVERCYRTWSDGQTMFLEFRNPDGLQQKAPIVAARTVSVDDGQLLLLWVRLNAADVEIEIDGGENPE